MDITTEIGAAAVFAIIALYCWKTMKGVERLIYAFCCGSISLFLLWPQYPETLATFLTGASASGMGNVLITTVCLLGTAVLGLRYILNMPPKRKRKKKHH